MVVTHAANAQVVVLSSLTTVTVVSRNMYLLCSSCCLPSVIQCVYIYVDCVQFCIVVPHSYNTYYTFGEKFANFKNYIMRMNFTCFRMKF